MNTDELIEQIHVKNAQRRQEEHRRTRSVVWRIAIPTAAAAAVLLLVLLPRSNNVQAAAPAPGIYCNSECNPDDVIALIDNNIDHIKTIQRL